ncbi:MAG: transketolase [Bacteroidetes bacterium]|nr:transketolase [Bacteroidota bacterium]
MPTTEELQRISTQVRRDIIRMVNGAASGHPGGSLGVADFMTVLYFGIMQPDHAKFDMNGKNEDLFFLSNGHVCPAWYSVLARYGFFPVTELGTFRKLGSRLQGHPATLEKLPGVRVASGSLGQGLSVSIGAAIAKKMNGDNHLVFTLCGDGELQEGSNWEALMFAPAKKIDKLVAVVDYNGKQIDGPVDKVMPLGNLRAKFEAFGWEVTEMDGNNIAEVVNVLNTVKSRTGKGKPNMIIMHTHMGYGVDFMMDNHEWHGVPPTNEQAAKALNQLQETLGDY